MGLASVFDTFNIVFNCFWSSDQTKRTKRTNKNSDRYDGKIELEVLNVDSKVQLKNLYSSDNVASHDAWTFLVIGSDKTYVCAQFGDFKIPSVTTEQLLNNRGANVMPSEFHQFLDPIWSDTLNGKNLQLFVSFNNRLYFLNSFALKNDKNDVCGACLFVRTHVHARARGSEERSRFSFEN